MTKGLRGGRYRPIVDFDPRDQGGNVVPVEKPIRLDRGEIRLSEERRREMRSHVDARIAEQDLFDGLMHGDQGPIRGERG